MILYLDTSVLVASMTQERNTSAALAWLGERERDTFAISDWGIADFSSALSIKLRVGDVTAHHRTEALAGFARMIENSLTMLPISSAHFRTAARFADRYALGLRSGDALHLAVCADHGVTLSTLDRRLARAGEKLGVKTTLV